MDKLTELPDPFNPKANSQLHKVLLPPVVAWQNSYLAAPQTVLKRHKLPTLSPKKITKRLSITRSIYLRHLETQKESWPNSKQIK